ncbi:MAG: conserved repeat domain protein [Actinobacteria bacterium]|nr:conserved repeat domain protein [Actinomycetota bacterium]
MLPNDESRVTPRERVLLRTAGGAAAGLAGLVLTGAILVGIWPTQARSQTPGADLSVAASASPNPAMILFPFSYTLLVANAGPGVATAVTLTENLPAQVQFSSTSASKGSCTNSDGTVACSLGSLAPGSSAVVTVDVTAPLLPACVSDSATVTGSQPDPEPANNSTSLDTQVTLLGLPLLGACPGPAPTPAPSNGVFLPRSPTPVATPFPGPVGPTPGPSPSPTPVPTSSSGPAGPSPAPGQSPSPEPTRSGKALPFVEGQAPPTSGHHRGLPGSPWVPGAIALAVAGSATVGLVTTGAAPAALLGVGRWRRGWRFGGDTSFTSAPPPARFELARAARAVLPQQRPANIADLLARRDYYRVPDAPEPFRHAALWMLALNDAVRRRGGIGRRLRGVRKVTIGFVEAGGQVRLAAIFYVRLPALPQAAPLFVTVDGQQFPVVVRPMYKDRPRRVPLRTRLRLDTGMVTSSVRLGGETGILTAAHVAARGGDKRSLRENDTVRFPQPGEQAPVERRVLRADPIMDAAVVEDGSPAPGARGVHAYPFAGYFPIEMRSPEGSVVAGHVVEMEVPQGVVPGAPGQPPSDPAVLLIDVTGQPGWSGSMVWEATYRVSPEYAPGPRPYGMFVGVRKVYSGTLGRVHMLTQIEQVWQLQLLEVGDGGGA